MIRHEHGFIFPYVLFIIILAFIILTANIQSYQTEMKVAKVQREQVKIETLLQMAKTQFIEDLSELSLSHEGTISYDFPQGNVHANYEIITQETLEVDFNITTDERIKHSLQQKIDTTKLDQS